ncbi:MAG: sugar transferase [Thermoleophilia bacterium]
MERPSAPTETDADPLPAVRAGLPAGAGSTGDIRQARPYLLSRSPAKAALRRIVSVVSLLAIDVGGLALGVYLALAARELWVGNTPILWGILWQIVGDWLPFLAMTTVLVFWRAGLYSAREFRSGFARVASSLVIVAVLTLAFAKGTGHGFSTYLLFPTAVAIAAILIGTLRASYELLTGAVLEAAGVRRRALLLGTGGEVEHLRRVLGDARSGIRYEFIGVVGPAAEGRDLPTLGGVADLASILAEHPVAEVIVADSDFTERQLLDIVDLAHRRGVHVSVAPTTTEILARRAQYVPGQGVPLFELRPPVLAGADWALKRVFDVALSVLLLVAGLPLWLLIAAAVKLTSPGPIFYVDRRIGLNERTFGMVKFRTMRADAALLQGSLEHHNEAGGALFKIRADPRVTPVGAILRRFSLDEIPNLLNVLRGEMSLVGPRPLPLRDFALLEPWHRKRYLVLPGMTGLWQISGRSDLGFDDLVRLDFYYLDNWSIWLDVQILVKTVPAVLGRRGAY